MNNESIIKSYCNECKKITIHTIHISLIFGNKYNQCENCNDSNSLLGVI